MTFLTRSQVLYATLILAFVAGGAEASLRRRTSEEYLTFESTEFEDLDAEEIEEQLAQAYAEDYGEDFIEIPEELPQEEPVFDVEEVEEDTSDEDSIPPLVEYEASPEQQEQDELEMLAHQYEEAMMRAAELEAQALYEQELAELSVQEGATAEEAQEAVEQASQILEDVQGVEEEIIQEEQRIKDELEGMLASSEERQRKLKEQEKHLETAMEEIQALAEERRRRLNQGISSSGKESATLNGITYEVEW